MDQETVNRAVLFADISGSTSLYETVGDRLAYELTTDCLKLLTHIVQLNQGRVIQTVGDEIMCTFPDPCMAAKAAIHMQEKISAERTAQKIHLSIKIGFHFGSIIEFPDDIFGDTVNTAARIAAQAKSNQILVSQTTLESISECFNMNTRWVDKVSLKGKRDPMKLYELTWGNKEDWTLALAGDPNDESINPFIVNISLSFADQNLQFMANQTPVHLGRADENHLVVINHQVSRQHAKIEHRQGEFILIDQSTNGTFIVEEHKNIYLLHRDEIIIKNKGAIGLGTDPNTLPEQAILYTINNK